MSNPGGRRDHRDRVDLAASEGSWTREPFFACHRDCYCILEKRMGPKKCQMRVWAPIFRVLSL